MENSRKVYDMAMVLIFTLRLSKFSQVLGLMTSVSEALLYTQMGLAILENLMMT